MRFPNDFYTTILHLSYRIERESLIQDMIQALSLKEYSVIDAYTPYTNPYPYVYPNMRAKIWAIACGMRKALETALTSGKPYFLYLEDDAVLHPDCNRIIDEALAAAPDFDIMYGGYMTQDIPEKTSPVFTTNNPVCCTHCLLLTATMAQFIIDELNKPLTWQADSQLCVCKAISKFVISENLKRYLIHPLIAIQSASVPSDNLGDGVYKTNANMPQTFEL